MKRSIKLQLNLFFAALLVLFGLYNLVLYVVMEKALFTSVDRHITDDAKIFEQSYFLGRDFELHPGYEFYAIRTPNGALLEASEDTLLPFSKEWYLPDLRLVEKWLLCPVCGQLYAREGVFREPKGLFVYLLAFLSPHVGWYIPSCCKVPVRFY